MAVSEEVISVYESDFTNDTWERPRFFDKAACIGKEVLFFPRRGENYAKGKTQSVGSAVQAKKICDTCLVWEDCFDYAMQLSQTVPGVYAGMSGAARVSIRRDLRSGRIDREQAISLAKKG